MQSPGKEGMDVYDTLLTQAEIQGNISQVNDVIRRKKAEEACELNLRNLANINLSKQVISLDTNVPSPKRNI